MSEAVSSNVTLRKCGINLLYRTQKKESKLVLCILGINQLSVFGSVMVGSGGIALNELKGVYSCKVMLQE